MLTRVRGWLDRLLVFHRPLFGEAGPADALESTSLPTVQLPPPAPVDVRSPGVPDPTPTPAPELVLAACPPVASCHVVFVPRLLVVAPAGHLDLARLQHRPPPLRPEGVTQRQDVQRG